jgi:sulfur carrier protein ThiS
MKIKVKLHATLRRYLPQGSDFNSTVVELAGGSTVGDLIATLGIPASLAKMVVRGTDQLTPADVLQDQQEINVYPPLAGGS